MSVRAAFSDLIENTAAFVVLILLGIASFFVTVFVVQTGAGFAGYTPSGNYVVLSAALIVASSILAGGFK
ncbi:MAG: hypothetical protein ABEK10_02780 [Candidatus Nanosalina sp.]